MRLTTATLSSSRSARYIAVASPSSEGLVADVEAAIARNDLVAVDDEGCGQGPGRRNGRPQQVVREALGGLRADARQARECLDQPGHRFDQRGRHVAERA